MYIRLLIIVSIRDTLLEIKNINNMRETIREPKSLMEISVGNLLWIYIRGHDLNKILVSDFLYINPASVLPGVAYFSVDFSTVQMVQKWYFYLFILSTISK